MLAKLIQRNSKEWLKLMRNFQSEKYFSKASKKMNQDLKVVHDLENQEFNIPCGTEKAVLQYKVIDPTSGAVDLLHTEVPSSLRGKGIAKILAKEALDHFANKEIPFKLTCWYLQKYFDENQKPEYIRNVLQ